MIKIVQKNLLFIDYFEKKNLLNEPENIEIINENYPYYSKSMLGNEFDQITTVKATRNVTIESKKFALQVCTKYSPRDKDVTVDFNGFDGSTSFSVLMDNLETLPYRNLLNRYNLFIDLMSLRIKADQNHSLEFASRTFHHINSLKWIFASKDSRELKVLSKVIQRIEKSHDRSDTATYPYSTSRLKIRKFELYQGSNVIKNSFLDLLLPPDMVIDTFTEEGSWYPDLIAGEDSTPQIEGSLTECFNLKFDSYSQQIYQQISKSIS